MSLGDTGGVKGPVDTHGDNLVRQLRALAVDRGVEIDAFVIPEEHDVDAGRLRMHYLDWGNPDAMPVVFAHPGRLNAHSWDLVCLALRARYHCLAFDVPGHGDSQWAPGKDYRLASCAGDFHGFANALGLEKFVLVGASQGGLQSLAYALLYPERLRGLVLLDAGPQMSSEGVTKQAQDMAVFEPMDSFDAFVEMSMQGGSARNIEKLRFSLSQNVRQRPDGKWVWKYDVEYRATAKPADQFAEIQRLMGRASDVRCPVLILHGARSDMLLADEAERLARRFPRGDWGTVPAARHLLHHDNPRAVIDRLAGFLSSLE